MTTAGDVLEFLLPQGGWVMDDNDFDTIRWIDDRPRCTKAEFEAGFALYDAWKSEQDAIKAAAKAALLERLGITAAEATLLLS
jgi:hypothetical protein